MVVRQNVAGSIEFFLPDETDVWSGLSGVDTSLITVQYLRSVDSSFQSDLTPTITELGSGWYRYSYPVAVVSQPGTLILRFTAPGAKTQQVILQVVAYNPYDAAALGLSNLDASVSSRAQAGDAMTLTSSERNSIASAVWSYVIEGTHTALKFMQWMGAVLFGKRTVSGTGRTYYGMDDTTVRVDGTVDSTGNRNITSRS
ncbi:MAG: hypothetical protein KatS3mg023_3700 [Armatimonadota bacterium]|nr:MAG: hypothetical protein KatS3mg023_3700 [Armatimonadota bacterium]